ncbi:MAG TPA: PASTA domain-containing protein, partial [Coriobacteriia bacterium]|nr:PASTA domain-containing protein [Coriobacteriia bacterium]
VVSQDPPPGTLLHTGNAVSVIVSAGGETVRVPGLVGVDIESARRDLAALGLTVWLRTVVSTSTVDTVIGTDPAAGASVAPGSIVRLTVSARSTDSDALVPYPMDGIAVLLDAVDVAADKDPTREVERRLRSLLEASGATVSLTRTPAGAASDAAARARVVVATTAAVVVSLDARTSEAAGMEVVLLPRDLASTSSRSRRFADALVDASGALDQPTVKISGVDDMVLAAAPCPALRVVLGSTMDSADAERFGDPSWLDAVAQALYRSLGTVFSDKGTN